MAPAALVLVLAQAATIPAESPPVLAPVTAPEPPPETAPAPDPSPDLVVPLGHAVALMTVMRLGEAVIWPDPFARTQHFAAHYEEAFTMPPIFDSSRRAFEWDGDPWYVNTLGHGLFGSELYLRARMCHLHWYGALAFAAASSTVWEYAFEGNGVRPSALDLVWTPLAGGALGEGRYQLWQAAAGIRGAGLRGAIRAVVDPFGEMERALGTGC
jgi:hypothetical protein